MSESNIELRKQIDLAATRIMLDSNFTDMTKLANEKYCNRLTKKVADVFQQNKDTIDLELLRKRLYSQHLDEGLQEIKSNEDGDGAQKKMKTSEKRKKTPQLQNIKKKCIQISKFYILFWHIFSCIVSTINPSFESISSSSSNEKTPTSKSKSNSEKSETKSSSLDFCTSRIDALINGELNENSDGDLVVKPNICKTNVSESGSALRLVDLPGMRALQNLYKDVNDDSAKDSEKDDAQFLYFAFTGKEAPKHITRLDQVPLRAFNKDVECEKTSSSSSSSKRRYYYDDDNNGGGGAYAYGGVKSDEESIKERRRDKERRDEEERQYYGDHKKNDEENARNGVYLKGITGSLKERLFSDYVQNIKEMIEHSETNRSRLLDILSELFTYTYDESGELDGVIINPSITYKKLQLLVKRTRRIIIKLYTDCEEDYTNGLDIFFAIVQEKIVLKLSVQDDILKKQLENTIFGPPERYIPESLLYQQQFQGAEDFNKKQFVPPHFKSSVLSLVKKQVSDDIFRQLLPTLNEWINEEVENATGLLDAAQVANEFLQENVFGDNYSDSSSSSDPSSSSAAVAAPSSSSSSSSSSSVAAPSSSSSSSYFVAAPVSAAVAAPLPAIMRPLATPLARATTPLKAATGTGASAPTPVSPSPKKINRQFKAVDIKPRNLSFILEENEE
jgi:hypothetical protein